MTELLRESQRRMNLDVIEGLRYQPVDRLSQLGLAEEDYSSVSLEKQGYVDAESTENIYMLLETMWRGMSGIKRMPVDPQIQGESSFDTPGSRARLSKPAKINLFGLPNLTELNLSGNMLDSVVFHSGGGVASRNSMSVGQLMLARERLSQWLDGNGPDKISRQLVLAAEDWQETNSDRRARLANALLEFAVAQLDSGSADDESAVRSAIRTYASMVELDQLGRLKVFLQPPRRIDARLATLTSLVHATQASGPIPSAEELGSGCLSIADQFARSHLLVEDRLAAMATNAIVASAALGQQLEERLSERKGEWPSWFIRTTNRKLKSVSDALGGSSLSSRLRQVQEWLLNRN